MNPIEAALVQHASETASASVPSEAINAARTLLIDTVACIAAGSSAESIDEIIRAVRFSGGTGNARVLVRGERMSLQDAAFVNSVMCHATDFDDTHDEAVNHGCVTIVPAMLAVCDALSSEKNLRDGWSGAGPRGDRGRRTAGQSVAGVEFLAALAIGLDVGNRIGLAFIRPLHTGWLPTTLWGPIAAASACGRLTGLDAREMADAFGFAYTQIHGNRQALIEGTLAKRIQPGFSAAAGVRAVSLAATGLSAPHDFITGDYGIATLYTGGSIDAGLLTDRLGERYETTNVSIKPYPCCRCTHPVIDAALELRNTHLSEASSYKAIESGVIRLPPHSMGQIGQNFKIRNNPTVDAQFSAQYTAALSFVNGRPRLGDFAAESVRSRQDIVALATRFSTEEFEPQNAALTPVELEVRLKDGLVLNARIEAASGSPSRPLTTEELGFKYDDCMDNAAKPISAETRRHILARLNALEKESDVAEVFDLV